ncbi:pirin family protein [Microcystis aeruginosa]|jgi:redox-sensitive bicupin YhaK (pirin superfamily)|uniref:Quercetin 2,3-dioxygenase n=1 Tax=Microcystis aeruginosa Sj TaxID=1979544 RepID=A0A2Z6ULS8_MICAE|nr:pirin family protein [Microcystis aeruginosa]MDB9412076.1 pirin family protein [Microcystis aeruginosa CS-567/02]MDB9434912.1 pirin family protein [Microcystis aeruginosa CS-552/01]GBL10695.1 quercetin 2,3-dioxygenase [Microcystis aeruginosa Sj]
MITIRKAEERGHANYGWLDTYHTFSFAQYYDPQQINFRSLRVINEDKVLGGKGFHTHGHHDMEILTYVLAGELEHQDSLGSGSVIRHGEIQRMSAGTGIKHSEFNHSATNPLHLLQIWIIPDQKNLEPSYEQKAIAFSPDTLQLIASPTGNGNAVKVHQDVNLYAGILPLGQSLTHSLAPSRYGWLQVARGQITLNDVHLRAGDGAAIRDETSLAIQSLEDSEILLFDLG